MCLLSELIDKEVRDVILKVDIKDVSDQIVTDVTHILSQHKGKHSVLFNLVDHINQYDVSLLSRKMKVKLDKSFLESIKSIEPIDFRIK